MASITKETAAEMGKKGGIKSGEARRAKKTARGLLLEMLNRNNGLNSYLEPIFEKLIERALDGDIKAIRTIWEFMHDMRALPPEFNFRVAYEETIAELKRTQELYGDEIHAMLEACTAKPPHLKKPEKSIFGTPEAKRRIQELASAPLRSESESNGEEAEYSIAQTAIATSNPVMPQCMSCEDPPHLPQQAPSSTRIKNNKKRKKKNKRR